MTRRRNNLDTESLDVEHGGDARENLDFARIASAAVNAIHIYRALDVAEQLSLRLRDFGINNLAIKAHLKLFRNLFHNHKTHFLSSFTPCISRVCFRLQSRQTPTFS